MKKLGYDVKKMPYKRAEGIDWMEYDVSRWDLLLAQNAFSVPLFRRAFNYDGDVFESGYPRNDILRSPHREEIAAAVRRARHTGGQAGRPVRADVAGRLPPRGRQASLPPGVRHRPVQGRAGPRPRSAPPDALPRHRPAGLKPGDCVMDVSVYPDISELFLITDVLVTDYSSSMFDFAVTGRPMVFFTYDLERYRDHVRGFYFDFDAEAPGPLLRTAQEVVEALGEPAALEAGYRDARAAFAARYCPHDDGHAAARVLDRVLQPPR